MPRWATHVIAISALFGSEALARSLPTHPVLTPVVHRRIDCPVGTVGFAFSVSAGDLDVDGIPDAVVGGNPTRAYSGRTGQVLIEISGPPAAARFGAEVDVVPGRKGDGDPRILVGDPGAGRAQVHSGTDGARLFDFGSLPYDTGLDDGQSMDRADDLTGDGRPDFLIGTRWPDGGVRTTAYSAVAGDLPGVVPDGHSVTGLGDLDGDGFGDFACGRNSGVGVYSGRTLELILRIPAWDAVLGAADLDGDGRKDLLVQTGPIVRAYEAVSGELLGSVTIAEPQPGFFHGLVVGIGDVDGDGREDFAASAVSVGAGSGRGTVSIFSGDMQTRIGRIDGPSDGSRFGWGLSPAGDIDQDGVPDLLVGAPGLATEGAGIGTAFVYRLVSGPAPVAIDLLPKSCPNLIPARGRGPIEVIVFGTTDVDVREIDLPSLRLADVPVLRGRSRLRDVGRPSVSPCACESGGPDGILDRLLEFDREAIRQSAGPIAGASASSLTLKGQLVDGRLVEGTDCVVFGSQDHVVDSIDEPGMTLEWTATPNPVQRGSIVRFRASAPGARESDAILILDARGRRVRALPAGPDPTWDGRDAAGMPVAAGVYFARTKAGRPMQRILILP